jgi:3-methyladenine DNA glycosylase Mpg
MTERNYKREYETYQGTSKQKKRRAKRNKARREALREGRVKLGDGMDIDHKDRDPNNNSKSNLRVKPKSANRSFSRKGEKGHGKRYG